MADSNDDGIPAWQRASDGSSTASSPEAEAAAPTPAATTDAGSDNASETADDKLTVARRFLDDDKVKNEPRDKKVAFLQSKGVEDEHIQKLLGPANESATEQKSAVTSTKQPSSSSSSSSPTDRAPIVTYPEFLTKPQRPPPLVTTQGLLTTLYGFAGLSTLVYGASKFVVEPMIESLNGARQELHDTTATKLEELVNQLERTVSVVPPRSNTATSGTDLSPPASTATTMVGEEDYDDEDPAEMFHRDIGTQTAFAETLTSDADTAAAAAAPEAQPPAVQHATNVTKLSKCVSGLRDDVVSQSGDFEDIKDQVAHFREELDRIIFPQMDFTPGGGYGMTSGAGGKNEPDDEVRKARDNIRRIKGVLLSTRSFPASTR